MAKVERVLTKTELGITQSDLEIDRGFIQMIFGDPEQGTLINGSEIVVSGLIEVEKASTTGDFFGSATMVVDQDGKNELRFKAPEINEEKAVSPDDKLVIDMGNETDPTKIALLKKMVSRAAPIKHLMRRVRNFEVFAAATMATEGKVVHHKGTIDIGFTNVDVLSGVELWSDNSADPIQDVIDMYYAMAYQPDAVFMGLSAKTAFMRHVISGTPVGLAANPRFEVATGAESDAKSPKVAQYNASGELVFAPSRNTRYIGRIVEIGLDVYVQIGKKIDHKGAKTDILATDSVLFAPINNRDSARWYFASIPRVVMQDGEIVATWEHKKRRFYDVVSDNEVTGATGILTSFVPVMRNPKHFKKVKVV